MKVRLTEISLEWLADHRIFFQGKGLQRLCAGDRLEFADAADVEPYIGIYGGNAICPMGFMSFSHAALPKKLTIGRYCSISTGLMAHLAPHPLDHVSTSPVTHNPGALLVREFLADNEDARPAFAPFPSKPAPVIEHDVWIGAQVTVLPGVRIATGAVVGAGSVVTRNVGPYEIVGGNPARLIRKRFPDDIVADLLESEWWRYKLSDFGGLGLDEPAQFVSAFRRRKSDLEPYEPPKTKLAEIPT